MCINIVSAYWQALIKLFVFYMIPTLKDSTISKGLLLDAFTLDVKSMSSMRVNRANQLSLLNVEKPDFLSALQKAVQANLHSTPLF